MEEIQIQLIGPAEMSRFDNLLHDSANTLLGAYQNYLRDRRGTLAWQVIRGNEAVAVVTIDIDGSNVGHINLAVMPSARRQGVGSQAIAKVVVTEDVKELRSLRASVSISNTAAQKILIKNGFSRLGNSPDGNLEFQLR